MTRPKQFYLDLKLANSFEWKYFEKGLHTFVAKMQQGYITMCCTEKDIDDGNIHDLIDFGLTR